MSVNIVLALALNFGGRFEVFPYPDLWFLPPGELAIISANLFIDSFISLGTVIIPINGNYYSFLFQPQYRNVIRATNFLYYTCPSLPSVVYFPRTAKRTTHIYHNGKCELSIGSH